jgi:DNA-binding NarL/FixJ family response regulator
MNGEWQRKFAWPQSQWISVEQADAMAAGPIRRTPIVLVIDEVVLTRECLARTLRAEGRGLSVETAAWPDAQPAATPRSEPVDVVLLNIGAARLDDAAAAQTLAATRSLFPDSPVVLISELEDSAMAIEAMRQRLRGYFPTSLGPDVLIATIWLVLAGGTFIPEGVIAHCAAPLSHPDVSTVLSPPRAEIAGLTRREAEVLRALRLGKPNKIIAYELAMSEGTVKVHVRNIMKKLSARNRTQLAFLTQDTQPLASAMVSGAALAPLPAG